jgi:hypothetical protein
MKKRNKKTKCDECKKVTDDFVVVWFVGDGKKKVCIECLKEFY